MRCLVLGLLAAGCTTEFPPAAPDADEQASLGTRADALSGVTFDTSGIASAPGGIPSGTLPISAFDLAVVQKYLVPTRDPFSSTISVANRSYWESAHWHAEVDASHGQVLMVSKDDDGPASPQNGAALRTAAIQRVEAFGVASYEILAATAHRTMIADDSAPNAPTVDGYKTFIYRGLNGIHVRGHRAVVTHAVDGRLRRVLMRWPALASGGHKVRTGLSTQQIVARATQVVAAQGLQTGVVKLRWEYVATQLPTGEVTLKLVATAALPYAAELGESRHVAIDVDAS